LNIDNLKEKLNDPDDKRAYYNIGFSYDESEFIFIHVRKVYYDEKRQEYLAKAGEEDNAKSIELGSIGDIQGMRSINDYRKIKEEGIKNA